MTDEQGTQGVPRRRWLAASGSALAGALAGCLGGDSDDTEGDGSADGGPTDDDGDSEGDGGNGSDNGGDNGDENGTDNGDENGTDGGDNGGDNGTDNGDDNGTDDPSDNPNITASLSALQVAGDGNNPTIDHGEGVTITVDLTNTGETTHDFDVQLAVIPTDSDTDEPVATANAIAPLAPEESNTITFAGVTGDLDPDRYTLHASTVDAETTVPLDVVGVNEVTVTIYDRFKIRDEPLGGGEVTAIDDPIEIDSAPVNDDGVATLELPLNETSTYTIEVTDPGGGIWPPESKTVTFDGPGDDAYFEVGHELNGADSYHFRTYAYDETGRFKEGATLPYEYLIYGTDMTSASELEDGKIHHHARYMFGTVNSGWQEPNSLAPDDYTDLANITPPEYGADFETLNDQLGLVDPVQSLSLDGEHHFYFLATSDVWSDAGGASYSRRWSQWAATGGLERFTIWVPGVTVSGRTFVGTSEVRGTEAYVYEVPEQAAYVHVDPETGYVVRYDQVKLFDDFGGNSGEEPPFENSFEVVEFWDHDEVTSLDWELIKNRSTDEIRTEDGEPDIDALPWEVADIDV
jgi:hypothetical protein